MKAIKTCGECPGKQKSRWQEQKIYYCESVKGDLDLSKIHPDCPLHDVPALTESESPNAGLAGKLRELIADRMKDIWENGSCEYEAETYERILQFLSDFDSSPDVSALNESEKKIEAFMQKKLAEDVPESPKAGLVGKLREFIAIQGGAASAFECSIPYFSGLLLKFLDDLDSSPDVPAPRVKKIEWKTAHEEWNSQDYDAWWGKVGTFVFRIYRRKQDNRYILQSMTLMKAEPQFPAKEGYASLELAQQAAQAALEAFAKGLIE